MALIASRLWCARMQVLSSVVRGRRAWRRARGAVDLRDPAFFRDPWPALAALRERGPVHRTAEGSWLVVDARLIEEALARPQDFSSRIWEGFDRTLIGADPPEHTRGRQMIAPLLGPAVVDPLADVAAGLARDAIAPLVDRPEFDLVGELAEPVVQSTAEHMIRDDVLAALPVEPSARAGFGRVLWLGATLTTVRHVGWAVLELDRRPRLRETVAESDGALDAFLNEALRLHPPEPVVFRTATRDVRLGGVAIPRGARVAVAIGAPGRDPALFLRPDDVVLDRPSAPVRAFGHGPHRCPGSRVAGHMARAIVREVLVAMPGFRVAEPEASLRHVNPSGHGLARLTVAPR
jgi:cytochrome P450